MLPDTARQRRPSPEPAAPTTRDASALSGDAIVRWRAETGIRAKELAAVLGVNRNTIYKWECDGFFVSHHSAASAIMAWLLALPADKLARVARHVRLRLADPESARAWLYRDPSLARHLLHWLRVARPAPGPRAT